MELALVTRIPMSEWENRPDEDIATALEILAQAEKRR